MKTKHTKPNPQEHTNRRNFFNLPITNILLVSFLHCRHHFQLLCLTSSVVYESCDLLLFRCLRHSFHVQRLESNIQIIVYSWTTISAYPKLIQYLIYPTLICLQSRITTSTPQLGPWIRQIMIIEFDIKFWWHYPLQIYSILNNVYIKKRLMCIHMRFQRKINYQVCLPTLLLELLQPPPVINPFSADFFEPPSETHWPLRWIKIEYITLVCRKSFL